jgi:hypothetical protein
MSEKISEVIGQGTYGCVHKPSLLCKNKPNFSYKNKVSKVLSKKDAKTELKEYNKVKKADKNNEYYLGIPTRCDVDFTKQTIEGLEKCKIGMNVIYNLNNYNLLIMEDGGLNI